MHNFKRALLVMMTCLAAALGAGTASAATLNATPATFAAQVAAAQPGDTVLLASGSYGSWAGTNKAITVKEDSGANATMQISFGTGDQSFTLDGVGGMSGSVTGSAHDITVKNSTFTGEVDVDGTSAGSNIVFDGNTHNNISGNATANRFLVAGGVTVRNSRFEGGGSDGVRLASSTPALIEGNTFLNILDDGSGNHTDNIQVYGGSNATVRGNFFKQTINGETQVFGAYDGTSGNLIEDNVIDVTGRNFGIELYDDDASIVRHNTVVYHASCPFNQPCGQIALDSKSGGGVGSGTQVYDNVAIVSIGGGSSAARNDHNTSGASVSYVGPTSTYAGFELTSPKGTASDGLDVGARFSGSPPPPVECNDGINNDPTEDTLIDYPADPGCSSATDTTEAGNPPVDHTPVAAFTTMPESSAPAHQVTFTGAATVCDDTPCTYRYSDDGNNATLGTSQTSTFTFQNPGTKLVRLTVTDVDGDVNSVEHDHIVSNAPPPDTTPPDTSITSAPVSSTSTSASVSFTGTDNVGVASFQCRLDGAVYATCISPKAYTGLALGQHTFDVRAVDAAGNTDPSPATAAWTVQAPGGVQLLGRNVTTGTVEDSNSSGQAQAYQYTATATGGALHVRVYISAGNAATGLKAGIYDGATTPTTLRSQGSTSSLTVGQWSDVTIPTTTLTSGTKYWIAILGTGGTLHYRDGNSSGGGLSYGSSQSNLTTLPATWSNGPNWSGSWALSGYATT